MGLQNEWQAYVLIAWCLFNYLTSTSIFLGSATDWPRQRMEQVHFLCQSTFLDGNELLRDKRL